MKFYEIVGARLQNARMEKNITQDYVAKNLKISRPMLSRIENGEMKISLLLAISYCHLLSVQFSDLFKDIDNWLS